MSASEQTSASKREAGYYWVNRKGYWSIAEFTPNAEDGIWFHTGSRLTHFGDYHWTEIDERLIERHSPQQQPDKCPQCNGNGIKELEAEVADLKNRSFAKSGEPIPCDDRTKYIDNLSRNYGKA